MVAPVSAVSSVLPYVVLEVAALAQGSEVGAFVVLAVAVEVGNGEHHAGEAVESEPRPGEFVGSDQVPVGLGDPVNFVEIAGR